MTPSVRSGQKEAELQAADVADVAPCAPCDDQDQELTRDKCEPWIGWLEAGRKYLLLVANREMGYDLKSKEGASDLVQETLLEAYRDLGRFTGRTEKEMRGWLRRLLMHKVAHAVRRYRHVGKRRLAREVSLDSGDSSRTLVNALATDQTSPGGHAVRREEEAAVLAALDRLPERMRFTVLWRHHEACSFDELGRRLGCSNVAARKLWLRALELLQRELNSGTEM
jgi:RNA polymerase sigma-70 factor, ECF subfamily